MRAPVADLVGKPGESRAFARVLAREEVESLERSWGPADEMLDGPIELDLHFDSVVEGILVRGRISFTVARPCARCLETQTRDHTVEVAELFADPRRTDLDEEPDEGYEIVDDLSAIDLSTMIRDAILMDLPVRVLCREDCQGLCPVCGTDRNDRDCGHRPEEEPDPRWAKLAELQLPN
ncbi:MAG: DUF177 domain-containing protein [Nitriliruptorales bacterium]|nr:DUF177 domain-containing protein [Nitriliruptorales bacterium]